MEALSKTRPELPNSRKSSARRAARRCGSRRTSDAEKLLFELMKVLRRDRVCVHARGCLGADDVEEELVDAAVVGELGVEGGGEDVAGADEDGDAVAGARISTPGPGGGCAGRG